MREVTMRDWVRSHVLTVVLCGALFLCAVADGVLYLGLRSVEAQTGRQRDRLGLMTAAARQYKAAREKAAARAVVASESGLSAVALEGIARRKGIAAKIARVRVNPPEKVGESLREHSVSLSIAGVTREALAVFLLAVEQSEPGVRTVELSISDNARTRGRVDARVRFSAYEAIGGSGA